MFTGAPFSSEQMRRRQRRPTPSPTKGEACCCWIRDPVTFTLRPPGSALPAIAPPASPITPTPSASAATSLPSTSIRMRTRAVGGSASIAAVAPARNRLDPTKVETMVMIQANLKKLKLWK